MILVKIVRGLDLATPDAELYLTLSIGGLSRTSKLTGLEKPEDDPVPILSPSPTPAENSTGPGLLKRESSQLRQLGWVWDEEFDLTLPPNTKKDKAEIEVCCFDAQFRPCGKVKIPLARLAPNDPVQQWYSLVETSNPKAAVMLKLTFVPEVQSANVNVSPSRVKVPTPGASPDLESSASTPNDEHNKVATEATINLPMGLADYFVVAGCSQETARQDRLRMLAKPRKKPVAFSNTNPIDELSQAYVSGPDAVTLSPVMLDRYPSIDRPDVEFPTKIEMFLLPDGAEIVKTIPGSAKHPRFFTVVLVTNGIRTYGFCLEAFEPLPRINKATDYEDLYAPVVLCYLTRVPLPSENFRFILEQTYEARRRGWFERVVQTVVHSIPAPLPGLFTIEYQLLALESRRASLPSATELPPLVFPNICSHAFDWFPLDNLIDLWIAALTEQKILVHSQNREALAMVSETIVQLMYPFKWENAYVPVLPTSLMQLFDAPIPAILGLRTDALKMIPGGGVDALADHWIVVDADKCVIHFPKHNPLPSLPVELRARLYRTIRSTIISNSLSPEEKDRRVRLAFLECLASMLQGYRESFFVLSTDVDASTVFNRSQFFQRQASQKLQQVSQMSSYIQIPGQSQVNDGGREFLEQFFNTTAFERFKVSQYDPETDFFHSVYAARRSRERERDQRSAALAALQGEAESAAAVQQQQQASNQAIPIQVTTTVVKLWAARDTRWSESALEPLDPGDGRKQYGSPILVRIKPPLNAGERVKCGCFGNGEIVAIQMNDGASGSCAVVKLDWGATAYLQLDILSRAVEEEEQQVVATTKGGEQPSQVPKVDNSDLTLSQTDLADEVVSEDEEDRDGKNEDDFPPQELLPVKTQGANFQANPISVVDEPVLADILKSEADVIKKAMTHLGRILGLNATDSKLSASIKPAKSAQDSKVERAMHRAITSIFQDKPVPQNDLSECANNLKNSQFARDMLIYVLKSQQSLHNTTGGGSNWLATPGRGRRLGATAFASLHELIDSLLQACAAKEDFTNGRCALEVAQFYYCEDDTLQNTLKGHLLWSKPVFWEYAFAEQFAISLDPNKPVPEPPMIGSDQTPSEAPAVALARLQEIGKRTGHGGDEARKMQLFEHLSSFVHTMLNLDVSEEMVRVFVDRVASVYSLDDDQKMILNELITNIARAALYNIEEERAQQTPAQSEAGSQPDSPMSASKRGAGGGGVKRHYSMETMTTSMYARFGVWRRNTKRSPNMGRRDSQTSQETSG